MRSSPIVRRPKVVPRARSSFLAGLARPFAGSLLVLFVAAGTVAAGCRRTPSAADIARAQAARDSAARALLAQSTITVRRTGGIAGIETEATVDGAKLTYAILTRRACATGLACEAPTDAASGPISADSARTLFERVDAEKPFELKDDYGTSPTLRDGFVYLITVRRGEQTKTLRADDVTQPPQMARIEAAVLEVIERARGR